MSAATIDWLLIRLAAIVALAIGVRYLTPVMRFGARLLWCLAAAIDAAATAGTRTFRTVWERSQNRRFPEAA